MGKPTIVFILVGASFFLFAVSILTSTGLQGGWHTADHFVDFLPYITPHYPVEIVSQPSVGINGSRGTLEEDAANSRAVIDRVLATGSDVVVVMHSYGGVVGACALKGLPAAAPGAPGVLMTVWLSAFVLPLGTSIFDGPSGVKGVLGPMSGSPWIKVDVCEIHSSHPVIDTYDICRASILRRILLKLIRSFITTFLRPIQSGTPSCCSLRSQACSWSRLLMSLGTTCRACTFSAITIRRCPRRHRRNSRRPLVKGGPSSGVVDPTFRGLACPRRWWRLSTQQSWLGRIRRGRFSVRWRPLCNWFFFSGAE